MPTITRSPEFPFPAASAAAAPASRPAAPVHADGPSPFASMLAHLGKRIEGGEALIKHATSTDLGPLDAPALIAVQAGIYRYVEAVDLASKLVDRATNAVKTVLQGNH